jgi:hypothetical protein
LITVLQTQALLIRAKEHPQTLDAQMRRLQPHQIKHRGWLDLDITET